MKSIPSRSGIAAVEAALLAPIFITLLVAAVDFSAALLSKAQISQALASSAEYATLAGQNGVATATIASNAQTIASTVSNPFVGTPTVTATVNQGAAAGSKCCLSTGTWSCSTSSGFTCADGSAPGVYLTVSAQYPFQPVFSVDTLMAGDTLTDRIIAPLQ
jgi:Flp pilus assembly protein TadG